MTRASGERVHPRACGGNIATVRGAGPRPDGSIPARQVRPTRQGPSPRVRGKTVPPAPGLNLRVPGSIPRACGGTHPRKYMARAGPSLLGQSMLGGSIPARAGETRPSRSAWKPSFGPSPRVRGKPLRPRVRGKLRIVSIGPSPRVRGKLVQFPNATGESIPARAGEATSTSVLRGSIPARAGEASPSWSGGSDLPRLLAVRHQRAGCGSIPARAGETRTRTAYPVASCEAVHPRACGGNGPTCCVGRVHPSDRGSIPARAPRTRRIRGRTVHPRACGGNIINTRARGVDVDVNVGPSPRVRGKLVSPGRSIPARAGETFSQRLSQ